MREIKFRAWDKKRRKMLYGVSPFTAEVYDENEPILSTDFSRHKDCVFEQYTGLKTRNGKEIYEGDIVRDIMDGDLGVVRWGLDDPISDLAFFVDWVDESLLEFTLNFLGGSCYEVVGNIHENPELLVEQLEEEK